MPKFKCGDRVCCVKDRDGHGSIVGKLGKVVSLQPPPGYIYLVSVEFDKPIMHGHSGMSCSGKSGHCWDVLPDCLVLHPNDAKIPDLIEAESYCFKVVDKITYQFSPNHPKTYYVIATLYQLVRKGFRRHYRVFITDSKFKSTKKSINDKFLSIEEAKEYIGRLHAS